MTCKKSFIQIHSNNLPAHLADEQGRFGFYVQEGVAVTYNRKTTELTELDKLVTNYANTFTVDADSHIQELFCFAHFTKGKNKAKKYRATLLSDGLQIMDGFVYVSETAQVLCHGGVSYSILFVDEIADIKEGLKNCDVCELDFGTVDWTESTILDLAANNEQYDPFNGYPPVYPALINLGAWIRDGATNIPLLDSLVPADITPAIYITAIIEQAFCKLGYQLESNFFQSTEYGRKLVYVAADYSRASLLEAQRFNAFMRPATIILYDLNNAAPSTTIGFSEEDDPNNLFDTISSSHSGGNYFGSLEFTATIELILPVDDDFLYFEIWCDYGTAGQTMLADFEIDLDAADSAGEYIIDVAVATGNVLIQPTSSYTVRARKTGTENTRFTWTSTAQFFNNPVAIFPNGIINPAQLLPCDSVFDILIDLMKMYGLKMLPNRASGKIKIEPANNWTDWDGINHNGFYDNEPVDITACLNLSESITKDLNTTQQNRFCQYLFNDDSADNHPAIDDADPALYSLTIDTETGLDGTTEKKTSLFAATVMDTDNISVTGFGTTPVSTDVFIPHIWAADRPDPLTLPERITAFAPRLMHVFGWGRMFVDPLTASQWRFGGADLDLFPVVAPYFPYELEILSDLPRRQHEENTVFNPPNDTAGIVEIFQNATADGITMKASGELSVLKALCLSPDKKVLLNFEQHTHLNGCYILNEFSTDLNGCGSASFTLTEDSPKKCL